MILAAAPFFPVVACIFLLHLNPSLSFSAASVSLLPVGSSERDRKREFAHSSDSLSVVCLSVGVEQQ